MENRETKELLDNIKVTTEGITTTFIPFKFPTKDGFVFAKDCKITFARVLRF